MEDYIQNELFTLPLYYQQAFIYESNKLNRNGQIYGNPQYNYDWDIAKWTVEPDASGKMVMNTNTGPTEFFDHPWFNPGLFITNKVLHDRLITCDGGLAPTRPKMAKYYNLSKDAKTLIFELRDGLQWHDGSGLSRYNLITPLSLVSFLNRIYQAEDWQTIRTIFPAGGHSK